MSAALPITALDDDAWEDLLNFIEERRVIPIVRPEPLMVATERGPREDAYARLRSIVMDANLEPPSAIRQLATITDLDVYVSTTADSLLEAAINQERFAGAPTTEVLSYARNRVVDLPSERDRSRGRGGEDNHTDREVLARTRGEEPRRCVGALRARRRALRTGSH